MMDGKLSGVSRRSSSPTFYCLHIQFLKSYSPVFGPVGDFVTLARAKELAKGRKRRTKKRRTLVRLVCTESSCPAIYNNVPVHRLQCVK